ncbi:MAG: YraN family protein [Lachnospiraceae bacterium]|nr:YraN family protein [Lachnospiraceae bacterium]
MTGNINKRKVGSEYEELAAAYLESIGFRILKRNFRCRSGEVDIIAMDGGTLVFAEVKYRSTEHMGNPLETVNRKKQRRICRSAGYYMMIRHLPDDTPCRFDVIGILGRELRHVRNAFPYMP